MRLRAKQGIGIWVLMALCSAATLLAAAEGARAAECTNTWTGPTGGLWQTAGNWSAGHVPTSSEVACIGSGKSVKATAGTHQVAMLQGEGSLMLREATLEILGTEEASSIKNFTSEYKSVLTGPATLNVTGSFEWASTSTQSGTGSTVLQAGATGAVTTGGGWATLSQRRFVNEGSLSVNTGIMALAEGGILENKGTLTVNHESGVWDILDNGGIVRPKVVNLGLLRKTAGTGETNFDVAFENWGQINAETGTFGFTLKGSQGFIGEGSTLKGSIRMRGPSVTAESFDGKDATLVLREATISIAAGDVGTIGTVTLDYQAKLHGAGTFEIAKSLWWASESMMSGGGQTVIKPGAVAKIDNYWAGLSERTLVNEGTMNFEGQGVIRATEGATIHNEATLNANSVESYARFPGILTETYKVAPVLINEGLIEKSVGTGNTRLNINVENSGTIRAKTGTLLYEQPGATVTLEPGSVLEGAHRMIKTGIVGEDFSVPSGSVFARESPIVVEGTNTLANLTLDWKTVVAGAGDLEVTQSFQWLGESTMGGSGKLVTGPSSVNVINVGATNAILSGRRIENEGTFNQISSSRLNLIGSSVFLNKGTYNLNASPYPSHVRPLIKAEGVGPGKFVNRGAFQRTEGSVEALVTAPFQNNGTIVEKSGKIEFEQPVVASADEQKGNESNCADPVNCATGQFTETHADIVVAGRGVGLVLARTYDAQAAAAALTAGPFGYGWTHTFSDRLQIENGGKAITWLRGDGSTVPFAETGAGVYAAPDWDQSTISGDPESGYVLLTGEQIEYRFSATGRLESVTDRNGNETTLEYDEAGRLEAIVDPVGREITLFYNGEGRVQSAEDPMGHLVQYAYEGGNLKSVTMPGEISPRWQFKYDASRRMTTMTDGRGGKTTNEYDSANRVKSQTDPANRTITFEYSSFRTKVTNKATGAVTDQRFNSDNQPYQITRGFGTADAITESFTYDSEGQLRTRTDGNGHTTTFGYDARGNLTSEKDAAGRETKWTYDTANDLVSMTTPAGSTITVERDSEGNVESVSRPGPGATTQAIDFAYDEFGQVESTTDPLERTWSYAYDADGNRSAETDPLGNTRTFEYDENARLAAIVSPRGNAEGAVPSEFETTLERDPQGRLTKITDPLGFSTQYVYDGNGNLTSETDANNHTTKYTYNAVNERTKIERPSGAVLETGYNGAGAITSQTDANKRTTTYVRNVLGQPIEVEDPLGRKTIQEYDDAGNLVGLIDAAERKTTYSYDLGDRLVGVDYSQEATADVELTYDPDGNLTSMVDGTGESSFEYDALGRMTQSENGHGDMVEYGYNLADEQTSLVYPNGKGISRTFDAAGRLEGISDWLGGTTTFDYNPDSQLEKIIFPAGTGNVDEYSYDRAGRMMEAKFGEGATELASVSYTREKIGQIEKELQEGLPGPGETTYGYDSDDRLTAAGSAAYEYDPADNIIKAPGTTNIYDLASQLESGTGVEYDYSSLGERIEEDPASGPATSYGYDQAGNLTSIARPAEGETPALSTSFGYDGTGLLASRSDGMSTRYLSWDSTTELPLILDDDLNSYIYGPGDVPVAQISLEGEAPTYLHHDQLGSTRMLTDATGEVSATFTYGPFGALAGSTGAATTPFGFAGQYTDAASGLQYLRARFYDPKTGQFLSRDPALPLTRSPYGYGRENPLRFVDPSGWECTESVHIQGIYFGEVPDLLCRIGVGAEEAVTTKGAGPLTGLTCLLVKACPSLAGAAGGALVSLLGNLFEDRKDPCFDFWARQLEDLLVLVAGNGPGAVFQGASMAAKKGLPLTPTGKKVVGGILDVPGTILDVVSEVAGD